MDSLYISILLEKPTLTKTVVALPQDKTTTVAIERESAIKWAIVEKSTAIARLPSYSSFVEISC